MISLWLFILSGVALAGLTLAKRIELKGKKSSFILRLVSRGDERARTYYHEALHFYSEGKHRFFFFVRKQLPLKAKSYVNKGVSFVKEKGEERFGNMRNSRTIKRPESVSEFFRNISEIEKGNGELHEDAPMARDGAIETAVSAPVIEEVMAPEAPQEAPVAVAEAVTEERPKKPRAPRKKKIIVVEEPVIEPPIVEEVKVEPVVEVIRTQPENFKAFPRKRKVRVVEELE